MNNPLKPLALVALVGAAVWFATPYVELPTTRVAEKLAVLEDTRNEAYLDQAGVPTICTGHTSDKEYPFKMGDVWSDEKCAEVLEHDIRQAKAVLDKYVDVPLTDNQTLALKSFVFNVGPNAFRKSTLRTVLNEGRYDEVPAEMRRWNKVTIDGELVVSKGLVNRREAEIELWLK
jgi:lysozyme